MKKALFVVVLALALTFALAAGAFATTGKFYKGGVDYYRWTNPTGSASPGTAWVASGTSGLGANPANPGVHANYAATTAKCGICHSVHRAAGAGTKLLPTADTTCAGCHTGATTITAKIITWGVFNPAWRAGAGLPAFSYGGAGPHNDALDTLYGDGEWDGISTPVPPSYATAPDFARYGCATRRCHSTNPHGANSSKYKIFAAKLLFNNTVEEDNEEYDAERGNAPGTSHGTYGGYDAQFDALGATDASVARFILNNGLVIRENPASAGDLQLSHDAGVTWGPIDGNETHALVAGLTCGRPSNPGTGEDECHAEATYAVVDRAVKDYRNHGTGITGNDNSIAGYPNAANGGSNNYFRTDNTGIEFNSQGTWYSGGNGNRDLKTGHIAGTFGAGTKAYAPIAGCTSCHDQTDSANTVYGNFTFPHGQTPVGTTNATAVGGGTGTMVRSRIWSGWSGDVLGTKTVTDSTSKAYDGQCLKCHRDGTGSGIGLTF